MRRRISHKFRVQFFFFKIETISRVFGKMYHDDFSKHVIGINSPKSASPKVVLVSVGVNIKELLNAFTYHI